MFEETTDAVVDAAPAVKPSRTAAQKEYSRVKKQESRSRARNKVGSDTEIKSKEAAEILSSRGLRNQHVIKFCVDILAQAASRNLNILHNRHLFSHGLRATLNGTELPEIEDGEVEGEILYRRDLYALWDYGFWRQPDVSFDQWLADRRGFKSSAYELSKVLGKEDFGGKHEEWTAFAPRWNPVGLHPDYTQREALAWLDSQRSDIEGDKKRYLLVAS